MKRRGIGLATGLALVAGSMVVPPAWGQYQPPTPGQPPTLVRKRVEVVFVLDTTGSMTNLIEAAKTKIWSIANTLASARPAPDIRMGLVGYRDRGDAYVTKITDLKSDLDSVYGDLLAFRAEGGGDLPESVNQALYDAVHRIQWSGERGGYRVIFLVGDCPPHMDYQDDVKYTETCQAACRRGIVINTIQCGHERSTEPYWRDIARRGEGRYFRVEQTGGAIVRSTPYDNDLSKLAVRFENTRVFWGSESMQVRLRDKAEKTQREVAGAAPAAQAGRAAYNASDAGKFNFSGGIAGTASSPGGELILDITEKKVRLSELKPEQLPESFRRLSAADREREIKRLFDERESLQKEINSLEAKRQAHLKDIVRKAGGGGFDSVIFDCIRDQAGRVGLDYSGAQKH